MKTSNGIQKNKTCPHCCYAKRCGRGFVILFAVTLSAILLSIALGVAEIAFRELKFSTSAEDTNNAFFAADVGIECAQYYDRFPPNRAFTDPPASMTCAGVTFTPTPSSSPVNFWAFVVSGLGSNSQGCAIVTVDKTGLCGPPDFPDCIISKGYNSGETADCSSSNPNRVEREIKLTY